MHYYRKILQEYGNYDKYFKNYTITKEAKIENHNDSGGYEHWLSKLRQLEDRFKKKNKLPNEIDKTQSTPTNIEILKMLENTNEEYNLIDYLKAKARRDEIDNLKDYQGINLRDGKPQVEKEDEEEEETEAPAPEYGMKAEIEEKQVLQSEKLDDLEMAYAFRGKALVYGRQL